MYLGFEMLKQLAMVREKIQQIWEAEGHKKMLPLTPAEKQRHARSSLCHICEKEIVSPLTVQQYDCHLETMKADKTLRWKRREIENLGPKGRQVIQQTIMLYVLILVADHCHWTGTYTGKLSTTISLLANCLFRTCTQTL